MPRPNMGKTREQRIAEKLEEQRKKIAEGLAAFKFRNRLTGAQVGAIIGVSEYTISHLLHEKQTSYTSDTIFKIIDAAGYELVKKEAAK